MKNFDVEKMLGVLNFNNMISVDESCIVTLNLWVTEKNDFIVRSYKKMAVKQLDWCQRNKEAIAKRLISYI